MKTIETIGLALLILAVSLVCLGVSILVCVAMYKMLTGGLALC
jgi:hypothetical protein